jgi:hypothetical protein
VSRRCIWLHRCPAGTGQQYLLAAILIFSGVVLSLATGLFNRWRAQGALPADDVAPVSAAG